MKRSEPLKTGLVKQLMIFLLIFMVFEKAGVSVLSCIPFGVEPNIDLLASQNNAEEKPEVGKETLEEVWISDNSRYSSPPLFTALLSESYQDPNLFFAAFYPGVPSPPPDHSFSHNYRAV